MSVSVGSRNRNFMLCILLAAHTFSFIDRQLLSILLPYIKTDLDLTDTQLGLLTGPAFAFLFVISGVPIGWLADRASRRLILACSIGGWSVMTMMTGFARSFPALLLTRMGVGVGEAGCTPTAQSLISSRYKPQERATAIGIYYLGYSFGTLVAFSVGGWCGQHFGWRPTFIAAGLGGLPIALLALYIIPKFSVSMTRPGGAPAERATIGETLRFLGSQRSFRHLLAGACYINIAYIGGMQWLPSFFVRTHGLTTSRIGLWLAIASGVVGAVGTFAGGWLSDRLSAQDPSRYMWFSAFGMLLALPFIPLVFILDNETVALACYMVPAFGVALATAPIYAVGQGLAKPEMRAFTAANMVLVITFCGLAIGPQLVGILSDILHARLGDNSLRYALVAVMGIGTAMPILHFSLAARSLKSDYERTL